MQALFVTTDEQLEELCEAWANESWFGLDTEFLRTRTYYPRLCLLQIATEDHIALVDPTSGLSMAPLCRLLSAPDITKVIHAARQDLEVLFPICQHVVSPVFDTQIAAALLGLGDQIGYGALVEALLDVRLAKGHTRADWCRRPLPEAQQQYAIDDVRYLGVLYHELTGLLRNKGRENWCEQECATLSDERLYDQDPELAFERTRIGASLPVTVQPTLKELAIWRERAAQCRDLPRNWIASDRLLAEIASNHPQDMAALRAVDGVTEIFVRHNGKEILSLLRMEREPTNGEVVWRARPPLSSQQQHSCNKLMGIVRQVADDSGIAAPLLATRREVEALVRGDTDLQLLSGWRNQVVGERLKTYLDSQSDGLSNKTVSS